MQDLPSSLVTESIYFEQLQDGLARPPRASTDHEDGAAASAQDDHDGAEFEHGSVLLYDPLGMAATTTKTQPPPRRPATPPKPTPPPATTSRRAVPPSESSRRSPPSPSIPISSRAAANTPPSPPRPALSIDTMPPADIASESQTANGSDNPRSPAADFLRTFASLHSAVPSSSSLGSMSEVVTSSATAYDAAGGGARSRELSAPPAGSWLPLAAAQPSRPDAEGSRIGPAARFTLGKTIGFGGSSTIREGWDELGAGGPVRVAVKIVYESATSSAAKTASSSLPGSRCDVGLWDELPEHPHLLPLLYYERVALPQPPAPFAATPENRATSRQPAALPAQHVQLFVMPHCGAGSLLDYVRRQGGRRGSDVGSLAVSRSGSLRSACEGPGSQPRTGSGFVLRGPRAAGGGGRIVSDSCFSSVVVSPTTRNLSASGGGALLSRRDSSVSTASRPRSTGVSLRGARRVLGQVARGVHCLHRDVGVMHGDLKLENVLGQHRADLFGAKSRHVHDAYDSSALGDELADDEDDEATRWRIADFGLAQRVNDEWGLDMASLGGSLAYAPPERFRDAKNVGDGDDNAAVPAPTLALASDMWAVGCMLYALLSGRLPFSDSFEPRLQAKIAKAQWTWPPRLWRRLERAANSPPVGLPGGASTAGSLELLRTASLGRESGQAAQSGPTASSGAHAKPQEPTDLSASVPLLQSRITSPPRAKSRSYHLSTSSSMPRGASQSSPSWALPPAEAQTPPAPRMAAGEADAESDEDEDIDQGWDGRSAERVAAREALLGLLEADPRRRWSVEDLLASRFLCGGSPGALDERLAAETAPGVDEEVSDEGRGRSRAPGASTPAPARPIPIRAGSRGPKGSASRSRSRSRHGYPREALVDDGARDTPLPPRRDARLEERAANHGGAHGERPPTPELGGRGRSTAVKKGLVGAAAAAAATQAGDGHVGLAPIWATERGGHRDALLLAQSGRHGGATSAEATAALPSRSSSADVPSRRGRRAPSPHALMAGGSAVGARSRSRPARLGAGGEDATLGAGGVSARGAAAAEVRRASTHATRSSTSRAPDALRDILEGEASVAPTTATTTTGAGRGAAEGEAGSGRRGR